MSGNGIRCFAQAIAAERGELDDLLVHTDAGERTVTMATTDEPDTIVATVDMGEVRPDRRTRGLADARLPPGSPGDAPQPRQSAQRGRRRRGGRRRPARARWQGSPGEPRDRRTGPGSHGDHDAGARARRRHHRSLRHRGLRRGVRRPVVGAGGRRFRRSHRCTWTEERRPSGSTRTSPAASRSPARQRSSPPFRWTSPARWTSLAKWNWR